MATAFGDIEIAFTESNHESFNEWAPFKTGTQVLKKGWTKDLGRRPMPVDVIWEKDVPIKMRDGVLLYGDVFRPAESTGPVPALVPWSPFGKNGTGGGLTLDVFKFRVGVPREGTSGLEKWESPDPAEWCERGYAVVNVDARGAYTSEGDCYVYGTQEARDGYDTIEWIGVQSWCNGAVALAGNSWLGTTQWLIAAEQPPHLKAMAPWEGLGDYYRETICRGGIPDHSFWDALFTWFRGKNRREDASAMVEKYPLWNEYWEDKKPKFAKIKTPMYATISYSTGLHTEGSMRGYFLSSSKEKWLRFIATQEWHDIYQKPNLDEVHSFFDHYCKGIENGWEKTPSMRLSLLGYNRPHVINRPITSYPPSDFTPQTFHLDASSHSLLPHPPSSLSTTTYLASSNTEPGVTFSHKFSAYTELCGLSRVKLYMSAKVHNDMDVFVILRKLSNDSTPLQNMNIPFADLPAGTTEADIPHENTWRYVGPNGRLRASHRALATEPDLTPAQRAAMPEGYLWHPHDKEEKLSPGEVVELNIGLWPGGMVFDAGESMALVVGGRPQTVPEFEGLDATFKNYNVGEHVVHAGGKYKSELVVYLSEKGDKG